MSIFEINFSSEDSEVLVRFMKSEFRPISIVPFVVLSKKVLCINLTEVLLSKGFSFSMWAIMWRTFDSDTIFGSQASPKTSKYICPVSAEIYGCAIYDLNFIFGGPTG